MSCFYAAGDQHIRRLSPQDDCFLVKNEDKTFEVSVRKVDSIMITTGAFLSTDAIKAAMDHNIDILFLDEIWLPLRLNGSSIKTRIEITLQMQGR
jgi:CRISPR/Cas system-associated endonuclease Cas1